MEEEGDRGVDFITVGELIIFAASGEEACSCS